jgi:hypothetical protein
MFAIGIHHSSEDLKMLLRDTFFGSTRYKASLDRERMNDLILIHPRLRVSHLLSFELVLTSSGDASVLTSKASNKSGCAIPCLGVPHTGHASAFKVISAPQHPQKAAT